MDVTANRTNSEIRRMPIDAGLIKNQSEQSGASRCDFENFDNADNNSYVISDCRLILCTVVGNSGIRRSAGETLPTHKHDASMCELNHLIAGAACLNFTTRRSPFFLPWNYVGSQLSSRVTELQGIRPISFRDAENEVTRKAFLRWMVAAFVSRTETWSCR